MDITDLLESLNDKQREAVAAPASNTLVLAGAGSGKTRVLVHRIAWLMRTEFCSPHSILAVTFTNKAAAEMRGRVEQLIGDAGKGMWVGTFHSLAHRLLRTHYQEVGLPQTFQVIDSDDQYRLVRRMLKDLNLDEKQWPPRKIQWYINAKKDEGLRPEHIEEFDYNGKIMLDVYRAYQEACNRAGLVDFAEILLRCHELLRDNETVREHYRRRFNHILVDEFQDTNTIQYAWLQLLSDGQCSKVMIVGDDDQSIYGWRGAKIENIQRFTKDFPDTVTIRLEQNYRSTGNILKAANHLIENNPDRMGKKLWTEGNDGQPISVYAAFNELDEARYIVNKIRQFHNEGGSLSDTAILYRNNAQSRVLEEALLQEGLAYRIYGGMKFFERQEIKDTLAYLRLISNRQDDAAFERVINTPTRGIGDRTLTLIREGARQYNQPMWDAARRLVEEKHLSGRAANSVNNFFALVDALDDATLEQKLHLQTDYVIIHSGLKAMYQAEKGEKARSRLDNLEELVTACRQFEPDSDDLDLEPLDQFLAQVALETGDNQADEFTDAVQMMTLHSAKGLEFPLVFMAGVEEGMFPGQQSMESSDRLEEERRLCYVGITRAMEKLYITHAESRRIYGQTKFHRPSRFIRELPAECIEEVRLTSNVSRPTASAPAGGRLGQSAIQQARESCGFNLGQRVNHAKFGEGTVLQIEGVSPQTRIHINFDAVGMKILMAEVAPLTAL